MKRIIPMIMSVALSAGFMFQSCQDTPDTVGGALVPDRIAVVVDSSFTLDGRSVVNTQGAVTHYHAAARSHQGQELRCLVE